MLCTECQATHSSWLENAFEDNVLQDDYEMDCSPKYTDGLEHELWWELIHKEDWNLHTFIEFHLWARYCDGNSSYRDE